MLCKAQGNQRPVSNEAKADDGKQKQRQSQKLYGTWHNVPSREKNQVLSVFSHAFSYPNSSLMPYMSWQLLEKRLRNSFIINTLNMAG